LRELPFDRGREEVAYQRRKVRFIVLRLDDEEAAHEGL
jgi:hypothetical protein